MPIANEDLSVWVVFNGEIYNYRELRQELTDRGHVFRTAADTEVIVHLYEELGERCFERLHGMFAIAVWDATCEKLVLARDRIGQKPVFYTSDGDRFLFGSEAKSLLSVIRRQAAMNEASLHHFLSLRFIPGNDTMIEGVRKLPPAHYLVYERGQIRMERYWHLSFSAKHDLAPLEWVHEIRQRMQEAVRSHLVSDVPVGAYLSGGLDSSMVVAMMAQTESDPVRTFAVGVDEIDFNELPFAKEVAERYRTRHIEETVHSDLIGMLPTIIWHMDEPSDPIAACQYYAAELAARHVKVVLGGDGGDELFAGFDRYHGVGYVDHYRRIPPLIRRKLLKPLLDSVPDNFSYKNLTQKLRWLHQVSNVEDLADRYAEATFFFRFNHREKEELFGSAFWHRVGHLDSKDAIADPFREAPAADTIDRMLYADFVTRLPEHSLMLTDRMSMAHSLELRSPYLDHVLVEFMAACPSNLKIRDGELKAILRDIAKDLLPPRIVSRDKHGFMFPIAYWFRGPLNSFVRNFLLGSELVRSDVFRADVVDRLITEHADGRRDHHVRLWMLINLEIWHMMYIQNLDRSHVKERMAVQSKR